MSTKQKAIKALEAISATATLEDTSSDYYFDVEIEAPKDFVWSGAEIHCLTHSWNKMPGEKSEFWKEVIELIKNELGEPVKCCELSCNEWGTDDPSKCGYWSGAYQAGAAN